MPLDLYDTIVALSTATGHGARAVTRLSGPGAWSCVGRLFRFKESPPPAIARGCYGGDFRLPGLHAPVPGELFAFPGPHSYTGQDVVEIHVISSPPLVEALIAELLRLGARPALPGEFTLRAFLAGKLDLTQAEAILGVIDAEDTDDLKVALTQLAGGMARPLDALRDELLNLLAEVEAGLDFTEEDLTFISSADLLHRLRLVEERLADLERQLNERVVSGRPFRVVLIGQPNAGKSSLFNALAGSLAALVSPEPGTTRDYLSRRIVVDGVEIELIDTAGLDESKTADDIIGQAQATRREQAERADVLLQCVDSGTESVGLEDSAHLTECLISVWTKCDLIGDAKLPADWTRTSAATGCGIIDLRTRLAELAKASRRLSALAPSWSRCRHHIRAAREHLHQAAGLVVTSAPPELLALELRLALEQLGAMVGAVYTDDLLDRIFGQFCIGK